MVEQQNTYLNNKLCDTVKFEKVRVVDCTKSLGVRCRDISTHIEANLSSSNIIVLSTDHEKCMTTFIFATVDVKMRVLVLARALNTLYELASGIQLTLCYFNLWVEGLD